jgi:hypothetical protein
MQTGLSSHAQHQPKSRRAPIIYSRKRPSIEQFVAEVPQKHRLACFVHLMTLKPLSKAEIFAETAD